MIKLFASDLDGTLFNYLHQADGPVISAIRAITDAGFHFAPASGRSFVNPAQVGLDGLPIEIVSGNGSVIRDAESHVIRISPLNKTFLEDLLRAFPTVAFDCITCDHTFVRGSREARERTFHAPNPLVALMMRGGMHKKMMGATTYDVSLAEVLAQEIVKVNCSFEDDDERTRIAEFIAGYSDEVVNAPFQPTLFEITARGVDKGEAVAWLASWLGIEEDEVAVYGDGGNDLTLLERFHHSYAPHGSIPEAKRIASATIGSNILYAVPRHIKRTLRRQAKAR